VSLTCVVTSDHKQKKRVMPQYVSPSIPCTLATAVLLPLAAEAAVETVVVEVAISGEAMVVEIIAETDAVVGADNNQP
jgi:hypothetical protein